MLPWILLSIALLAAAGWSLAWRFRARVENDSARVQRIPASAEHTADMPQLLASYVVRTGLTGEHGRRWSRIQQVGEMRLKPQGQWMPFTAVQTFAVSEPAFVWSAHFRAFYVADSLVDGVGSLDARLLAVMPVARASGPETTSAQLLRYLAEIAWVPRAITDNPYLVWNQVSPTEVLGTAIAGETRVELRFHFDEHGDIHRVEGQRDRLVAGKSVPTPWVGRFFDYRIFDGVRIPTRGEVEWTLDSGPFTYWRGAVVGLEMG